MRRKVFGRVWGQAFLQKGFPTTSDIRIEKSTRHQLILTYSAYNSVIKLSPE